MQNPRGPRRKLTTDEERVISRMIAEGHNQQDIALMMNISQSSVSRIAARVRETEVEPTNKLGLYIRVFRHHSRGDHTYCVDDYAHTL